VWMPSSSGEDTARRPRSDAVLVPSKSSLRPAQIRWGGRKHPTIGAARLPARYSTRRATTATFRPGPPLRQHGPSPVPPRAPPAVGARAEAEGAHGWDVSTSELGSRPRLRSNFFAPSLSPRSSGAARADGGGDGDGDGSSALARCDMMPTRRDGVGDRAAGGAARGGRGGRGGYDRSPPPVLALSRDSRGGGGGPSAQERGWGDDDGYSYDQRGPPVEGWERARDRVWGGGGGGYDPCGPSAQDRGRIGGGGPPCAREGYHVRGPGYEWQGGGGGGGGGGGSGGGGGDGDGWGGGYGGGECDRGGGYGRGGAFGDRGYYDRGGYGGPDRGDAPQWWGGPGTPYDRPGGGGGGGCGGRSGTGGGGGRGRGGGGGGGEGDWGDRDGAQDDRGYGRGGYGPDRGRAPPGRGGTTLYDRPQGFEPFLGGGGTSRGVGGGGGGSSGGSREGGGGGGYGGDIGGGRDGGGREGTEAARATGVAAKLLSTTETMIAVHTAGPAAAVFPPGKEVPRPTTTLGGSSLAAAATMAAAAAAGSITASPATPLGPRAAKLTSCVVAAAAAAEVAAAAAGATLAEGALVHPPPPFSTASSRGRKTRAAAAPDWRRAPQP
jgi:hypothetical protein